MTTSESDERGPEAVKEGDLHMKNYKVRELWAIAKERKIPRYKKYRKLELAQMLETDSVAVKETSRSKPKKQHEMIQSTATWFDLSLDLMVDILCRVAAVEKLGNVRKVCRDWHKICKDPSMWRVVYIDSEYCSDCRPYPWPSGLPKDQVTARMMCRNAVDRSQGQLVDITMIGFCDNELLEYVADRSPLLSRLEVAYYEDSVESLSKALKKLPKLEELSIYCALDLQVDKAWGSYCPELKTLRLNRCNDIGDEEIIAISENLRELRHLEIHANVNLSNTGVQAILDGCPCLKVLDLRLCVYVDLNGDIGKRLEHIECVLHTEPVKYDPYYEGDDFTDLKTFRKNILDGDIAARMSDSD
ncbi:F-box domain, Leucine-rich repeat domain, L domain-like protein [Artemisia annua]|uniref:F-box domain, Leucine-rich repeat domain, L domain-like protein n=1 Tax=Artemisia annua TaxID=35608 RepID=A0A2U1PUS2_ARTAN|nr:F-box domain, Leucine-rich repeat domain, L domain-like protein [Artemisia annua]